VEWTEVRQAVGDVSGRVAALLRETADPGGRAALGTWSVGDVAAHLVHVWEFDALQAAGAPEPVDDLARLKDLTGMLVAGETDREPASLAARVQAAAARFLEVSAATGPDEVRAWIGGVKMPVDGLASHAISESLVHGHDLATATGRPWAVPRAHARMAVEGFMLRVVADPASHDFTLNRGAIGGLTACFELRVRGGSRTRLVFEGGSFRAGPPDVRPVDCYVSADPAALLMVMWKRRSQWPAIARGQLLAWGRKPWLGLKLNGYFNTA
jgi:uncharacterized protein (TIGR03083 family)